MFGLCKRGHSLENAYVYKGCRRCNVALGMADDSPELLTKMAKYVANFKVGDVTCLA